MKFAMPRYLVKYHEKGEWEQITELEFLERMLDVFETVTPAILEIIESKQIQIRDTTYRVENLV
jgi:hypothetical protein